MGPVLLGRFYWYALSRYNAAASTRDLGPRSFPVFQSAVTPLRALHETAT